MDDVSDVGDVGEGCAMDATTPDVDVDEAGRDGPPKARKDAIGIGPGVCHSLGLTALVLSEIVRHDLKDVGKPGGGQAPGYLRDLLKSWSSLAEEGWYRTAAELFDDVSLGQPRAALWAAVFMALVVRLNRNGPHEVQRVISVVAACYCLLGAVSGLPLAAVAPGGGVLLVLGLCAGVMRIATR
ncbi:hypothetical protein [Streptomyces pactum]|uniref:hypothetical protein n=2 Tax=Streptomyces pactum TaxID=68249 RepID=UPI0036F4EE2B